MRNQKVIIQDEAANDFYIVLSGEFEILRKQKGSILNGSNEDLDKLKKDHEISHRENK